MPANLPPQYFDVEKKYREAKELQEKLVYLQQMLSVVPKHKGTEKLQAELKTKISKLKNTIAKQKKSKGSGGIWYQVEKQGAGQVVLVGLPNCGKSTVLNTLTNAHAAVGDYPFTTQLPKVGMMEFKDIKIQIVDTPPLHDDAPAWLFGLYRNGDLLLIVLDASHEPASQFDTIHHALNEKNIFIRKQEFGDFKNTVILLNKVDVNDGNTQFVEQYGEEFVVVPFSTHSEEQTALLKEKLFDELHIIRVYTKKIGRPVVRNEPIVLKQGTTVLDAAEHIHKDFKKNLKFARLWSDNGYSGQRVEKHHILTDGDVIEFHV